MLSSEIIEKILTLEAHVLSMQNIAAELKAKLQIDVKPKKKRGLSEERKAELKANRMKTFFK